MTATESLAPARSSAPGQKSTGLQRALLFGTGFGIEVSGSNLELAIVRARPGGPVVLAAHKVSDFADRPAAEWGAEVSHFLAAAGESKLAATLLLPRSEIIIRTVHLPGVPARELASAIALQLDTLHPYGEDEAAWAWCPAGSGNVLVGIARKATLDKYETIFAEAGIPIAAVTFSAAVLHSALRIWNAGAPSLCYRMDGSSRVEVYGESEGRSVYSAEFPLPVDRALAVARAELRVAPDTPGRPVEEILPVSSNRSHVPPAPFAYAAAMLGAVPRATKLANLLPPERRASHGKLQFVLPAALAILLLLAVIAVYAIYPAVDQKRYIVELGAEAKKLEPAVRRVTALEAQSTAGRARIAAIDQFASRAQADLDVLNELTRILPAQVWTSSIEILPDSVLLAGEAEQAAPLLKLLDSSPLFQNSEFGLSVTRSGTAEQFRIKTLRRGRIGRATP